MRQAEMLAVGRGGVVYKLLDAKIAALGSGQL